MGEAARTLTHEIKNPLSAIRLQSALLRRTAGATAAELEVIDEEVDRLAALGDRVSDFLRDPAGNPETIVSERIADRAQAAPSRAASGSSADDALAVRFDRERLRSAVGNLIRNAEESGGDGAPVEVIATANGRAVTLSVLDRGGGIAPEQLQRVFDPFFTTKSKGSGIGLPITLRFIEAAGGSLQLAPRPGGGTEARVTLPRTEAAS